VAKPDSGPSQLTGDAGVFGDPVLAVGAVAAVGVGPHLDLDLLEDDGDVASSHDRLDGRRPAEGEDVDPADHRVVAVGGQPLQVDLTRLRAGLRHLRDGLDVG
jgi:hypothetical protein